jgi:peptidoglycan/LPS O-acetylase OafA/YrhL
MTESPKEHEYSFLDGLRGLAAILVAQRHAASILGGKWFESSYLAVDFFFVLSGFVIAHAYGEKLIGGMSTLEFGKRRLIRLYPTYFVSIIFIAIYFECASSGFSVSTFALSLLFMPNLMAIQVFLLPTAWSLFCECVGNIMYVVIVKAKLGRLAILLAITVGFVGVIACAALYGSLDVGFRNNDVWGGVARVMFDFFAGVVTYRFRAKFPPLPLPMALVFATILGLLLTLSVPVAVRPYYDVFVLMFAPILVLAASAVRISYRVKEICGVLGDLSYPLYLLHMPAAFTVAYVVNAFYKRPDGIMMNILIWTFVVAIAAVSWLFHRFVDRPFRLWVTVPNGDPPMRPATRS